MKKVKQERAEKRSKKMRHKESVEKKRKRYVKKMMIGKGRKEKREI